MSDREKINSEIIKVRADLQRISVNQGLMKINRLLLTIVFSLMVVIVILGFSSLPSHVFVNDYKNVTANDPNSVEMNPVLSAEVNTLKGQLVGLVSGSMESKLRALEESIQIGSVANALGTIEDLKNDIKVLRVYAEAPKKDQAVITNEQLVHEVSKLKTLIYLTLGSCGLMLAAAAGIWIKNSNLLPHKQVKTSYLGKN
ncbi:MAG: hypothetical protein HOP23_04945 [Methylococcaceae bacterium]|nr:hypothetical protein [Methylococcaceae bacterium]